MSSMTNKEAKDYLATQVFAPDDLVINGKLWKLECTYLTRPEALASADFLSSYRLFRYPDGYALYERNYDTYED